MNVLPGMAAKGAERRAAHAPLDREAAAAVIDTSRRALRHQQLQLVGEIVSQIIQAKPEVPVGILPEARTEFTDLPRLRVDGKELIPEEGMGISDGCRPRGTGRFITLKFAICPTDLS